MAGGQPGSIPTPRRYPRDGRPRSRRLTSWGRGRFFTDGPSNATCSVSALRRPRLRAPARAPDFAKFTGSHHAPKAWAGEAVLYRPIQKRHLPASAWTVRAPLIWPRGRGRPSPVRRFAAPVGSVGLARMSSRPPAPVSHDAPCGASVSTPAPIARRVTVGVWPTCERRRIRFMSRSHGASVQATTLRPDRAHARTSTVTLIPGSSRTPSTFLARTTAPRTAPRLSIGRSPADHDRLRTLPAIYRLSWSSSNASVQILGTPPARRGARSFAGASPRMVDVRRERARQHRPRPCHK